MIDHKQFLMALEQIAEEKGISKEKVVETLEHALAAAYKKDYAKKGQIIRTKFDLTSGKFEVFQVKLVVDESMLKSESEVDEEPVREREDELELGTKKVRFNPDRHIMLDEAKKNKKTIKAGEEMIFPLEYHADFGRIAAQTAKQVIMQRIREAERSAVFEEFHGKEGEVVSGQVQRIEGGNVFVDLGRTVGIIFPEEQIQGERFRMGARVRAYILRVEQHPRGPSIVLSRSHPRFVSKLFEFEVPEVATGVVEVKAIAREAGSRTKIAVSSKEKAVDPVGSLVGQRGTRVSTVINELGGEKIDIVEWLEDNSKFISNALAPAKVVDIELNEETREAKVVVPEEQLSLAIGRGGQNVRLAARLTGWKIDVRSLASPEKSQEGGIAEAAPEEAIGEEPKIVIEGNKEILAEGVEILRGEEKKPEADEEKPKKKRTTKKKKVEASSESNNEASE
ncbi:transcription termination/antitermination protein NusA [Candidatus Parcubacteria bacterium]|nr:MAG: transcription termination/antitermination protein NusA [Candidatus Parcubacteria bacterium]